MFVKVLLLVSLYFSRCSSEDPCVQTRLGTIVGSTEKNYDNKEFYQFIGVPYARVPVGPLRFKDPEPRTEPYENGVLEAKKTKRCIQFLPHNKVITGTEDCLYLNIYTTSLSEDSKYPVMVFIHGGGFFYGAGHSQTPEYLLAQNTGLVFVSINYRLGLFGFLSTEDEVVPGNMGLKDQVMALRWVKENIRLFGGNPDKVTISGMSAGGISVHLHYLSPMSRDLFDRGISMSGVALSHLVKTQRYLDGAQKLAALMQCPTELSTAMVDCLRTKDAKNMLKTLHNFKVPWETYNSYMDFGPVVEKGSANPFLEEHPFYLLRNGKIKNAPWLVSATMAEGLKPAGFFIDDKDKVAELNEHWNEIAPYLLMFRESGSSSELLKISETIRKHYLEDRPISQQTRDQVIKLIGDRLHMSTIENAVRLHAKASQAGVFMYMFAYRGKYSFSSYFSKSQTNLGASHIDDLLYILKMSNFDPLEQDDPLVEKMTSIWTSFMKGGPPKAKDGLLWPCVSRHILDKGDISYLEINTLLNVRQLSTPDLSERQFWDSLPLDELHVVGNKHIPRHIQDQEKRNWLSKAINKIFRPTTVVKDKMYNFLQKVR